MKPKSSDKIYTDDIYDLLDHMEKSGGLFVLRPNLELLYSFISGVKFVSFDENIEIKNVAELDKFSKFLMKKFNLEYENTMGWFGIIANEHGTEKEGYYKFFEYLNEFRNN